MIKASHAICRILIDLLRFFELCVLFVRWNRR